MSAPERYTYRVEWSEATRSHLATCLEFPDLNYFDDTPILSLHGIMQQVSDALVEMREHGQLPPAIGVTS